MASIVKPITEMDSARRKKGNVKKFRIEIFNIGDYICEVDGKKYIFSEVLTQKCYRAHSLNSVTSALYRFLSQATNVVSLYGVKAVSVDTLLAYPWFTVVLHEEDGTDVFEEVVS